MRGIGAPNAIASLLEIEKKFWATKLGGAALTRVYMVVLGVQIRDL